jgi:membrane protease YdiL (CAAX protease family)
MQLRAQGLSRKERTVSKLRSPSGRKCENGLEMTEQVPLQTPKTKMGTVTDRAFPYATWGPWVAVGAATPFLLIALLSATGPESGAADPSRAAAVAAQVVLGIFFIAISLVIAIRTSAPSRVRDALGRLGFVSFKPITSLISIGLGALAFYLSIALIVAFLGEPEQENIADAFGPLWIQFLLIAIAAPITEEVFFRGMIFGGLRTRIPMFPSALLSGLIFGSLHFGTGPSAVLPLVIFGVVLAVVYEKTRSLWPPIMMHVFNNALALTIITSS